MTGIKILIIFLSLFSINAEAKDYDDYRFEFDMMILESEIDKQFRKDYDNNHSRLTEEQLNHLRDEALYKLELKRIQIEKEYKELEEERY